VSTPSIIDGQRGTALLELDHLSVHFEEPAGLARAVDGVSLSIERGEAIALLGESGCGKSLTALAIMGLLPAHPGLREAGDVRFLGQSLRVPGRLSELRGRHMAMIFQDPRSALNPVLPVGEQLAEGLLQHLGMGRKEARLRVLALLWDVGISNPELCARQFAHQLSGGMCQRVMIAMATATEPELLVADEPTTALDVTVQAEILALLGYLVETKSMGMLLITHDLGVVAESVQRAAVMYAGRIVESAPVERLFRAPGHPYTKLLMASLPELAEPGERLPTLAGSVPRALDFPSGCRFRTRCPLARERCASEQPASVQPGASERVACHFPEELGRL